MWLRRICITLLFMIVITMLLAVIMFFGAKLASFGSLAVWAGASGLGVILGGFIVYMIVSYPQDVDNFGK